MQISDDLLCLFSGQVEQRDGSYVIEIPEHESNFGTIQNGGTYRVAVLSEGMNGDGNGSDSQQERQLQGPPVEEGDRHEVEIEDIGQQGDGIARVDRGFVVIVPETEEGERVTIEITEVGETVAFAEVVHRQTHDH